MKIVTKKVYYCDFCKKHGLSSIKRHEQSCTANPNRVCRMCNGELKRDFDIQDRSMNPDYENRTIMVSWKDCPACTLSFIRLNKVTDAYMAENPNIGWSWDEHTKHWWQEKNKEDEDLY